ncbi:uncharacterized protein LOC119954297 [Scyliorhinus canicula]|uniref:uncharacterized protein LOC119954297 n=1 Tax=Scyliorhinus canicula TaxID=7830 RepID=UPI0018F7A299|nr:uncharacterized protein LOC119954297 [Scyliorhinus canicula]
MLQVEKGDLGGRVADCRSQASSLGSELDETDYEVRRLTALTFRSLAGPHSSYLDVCESRASSESLCQSLGSSGTGQWALPAGARYECVDVALEPPREDRTVPKRQIELKARELPVRVSQGAEPLAKEEEGTGGREEAAEGGRRRAEPADQCSQKAKFASCHISNVISKKMQFEQELKMERGAIQDPYPSVPSTPSSAQPREFEFPSQGAQQQLRRQDSKSESEISLEDFPLPLSRRSCELGAELVEGKKGLPRQDSCGSLENRNWRDSHPDCQKAVKSGRAMGLCADKTHPAPSEASNLPPDNAAPQSTLEDRHVDSCPQIIKEPAHTSYLGESKQAVYEDCYQQLGNTLGPRSASRNTLKPQLAKMIPAPRTTHEREVDPYGTVEQLAPNIGSRSKIITLDPKYQTLPASFKFETDDCRITDPQFGGSESLSQLRSKGPIHQVRDVRKLVKNTYGALSFSGIEAKPSGFAQVLHPDGSQLSTGPVDSTLTMPIYIQCKSVSCKGHRETFSGSSVDKKYWTYAGSTDTSRLYSADIKLLIPSDSKKNKTDAPKKAESESQTCKNAGKGENTVPSQSTDLKNITKINKVDKPQTSSVSSKEATRISPIRDGIKKNTKEKQAVNLVKQHSTSEDCNLLSETNKVKRGQSTAVEKEVPHYSLTNSHTKGNKAETVGEKSKKDSAESIPKEEGKVPKTPKQEEPVKQHNQVKPTGHAAPLKESLSLKHGKNDAKNEAQDRPENQNKLQKISASRNNDTKTLIGKNESITLENQSNRFSTSIANLNSTNISKGKEKLDRKVDSRLDHQKTPPKMSLSNSESTQELTRKGESSKESQSRKLGNKSNLLENLVLKIEEMKGNDERAWEGQGKVEQKNKHFGNSTISGEGIQSLLGKGEDVGKIQLGLEKRSVVMSSSHMQTVDISKFPGRGEPKTAMHVGWQREKRFSCNSISNSEVTKSSAAKYETVKDIRVGLENQNKKLGSSNEGIPLPGKFKAINESQTGLEIQKMPQDNYTQSRESIKMSVYKSETKKQSLSESENLVKKGKAEQASEKTGLKMLKESQPMKDSYVLSLILEEESKNNLESSNVEMRNKQSLSVKHHLAQTSISSSISTKDKQTLLSVKATDYHQTATSSVKTSTHKREDGSNTKGSSAFTIDIPIATTKVTSQQTNTQIHSSSAEFNVKTLPPVNTIVKFSEHMNKPSSSAVQIQPTGGAATQEHALLSLESFNYLTIPLKEQKVQVPNPRQTATSPHSAAFKSNPHSSAMPYFQHQRSVEAVDPQRQENQTISHQVSHESQSPANFLQNPSYTSLSQAQLQFSPCTKASNVVETICEVPQSSQDLDNPHVPCFPYPQTQRKMLVDPETGKYYFVDAPLQPPRKMLLDPETGQYVEVVMPQHPYGGVYQVPFHPYLLNPGVMNPSYLPNLPYPGLFVGPAVTSQRPMEMQGQLSQQSISQDKTDSQHHKQFTQRSFSAESANMESLYYIPTGVPLYPNPGQPGLQQLPMQVKSCAEVNDSKATGIWSMQQCYGVSSLLPHGRPSSFMVE